MKNNSTLGPILLAATSFCGGVVAGLLLSPKNGKRNRLWLTARTRTLHTWLNEQKHSVTDKSLQELDRLRNHIQQGVRHNVPDLYEATETIPLNGDSGSGG